MVAAGLAMIRARWQRKVKVPSDEFLQSKIPGTVVSYSASFLFRVFPGGAASRRDAAVSRVAKSLIAAAPQR